MAEQPRITLWLSEDAIEGIRDLVQNRGQLEAIFRATSSERPASSLIALATRVAGKATLDLSVVYDVLIALWNLRRLHMSGSLSAGDFVSQISASLHRQPSKYIDQETRDGWPETAPILGTILPEIGREHQLFISQKAQSLAYSHQNLVMSMRLITDIRPVFDDDITKIHEMMIFHTLSIQYVTGHGAPMIADFALDAADLRSLTDACERASKKLAACSEALRSTHFNPVIIPETGDDA